MSWAVASASVRGARHVGRGEPNEDAHLVGIVADSAAIVLADGHGSERCPRAAKGAEIAVEVVFNLLTSIPPLGHELLAAQTVRRWRAAVEADILANPLTESEAAAAPPPHHILYGTTVIGVVAHQDVLRVLQVGDGDVLVGREGARHARRPIPPRELHPPGATDSLCQSDAETRVSINQYDLRSTEVDAVLIATDGLDAGFAEPAWHDETMRDLIGQLGRLTETSEIGLALESWCRAPAEVGGDDTTLALLVSERLMSN